LSKTGDWLPVLAMGSFLVGTIAFALTLAPLFEEEGMQAFEDPESLLNPLMYLGIVLLMTGIILALIKFGMDGLIKVFILVVVLITLVYVFAPMLGSFGWDSISMSILGTIEIEWLIAFIIAIILTTVLTLFPEWYVVDIIGVLLGAGVCTIIGISLGVLPVLILLIALAVYDAWAVYSTKHMVDLADSVLELRLPILLVIPRRRGYSFLEQKGLKEQLEEDEERDAMFMGLGDIILPGVLSVSALTFLPSDGGLLSSGNGLAVALFTLAGLVIGFSFLMKKVMEGKPQAGLPCLNGGAIGGYIIGYLIIFGDLGLGINV